MPSTPTTVAPYNIGAEWHMNVPGHTETDFFRSVNATLEALPLTPDVLRSVALELWTQWAPRISADYPEPVRLAVTNTLGHYVATVEPGIYPGPSGSNAATGFSRATCLLIRGHVEPYPVDEVRADCFWLIQSWGHYALHAGRRRLHRLEVPGVSDLLDFLDTHPWLWADRYGRKARCWPYVDVFAHPQIQRHYWLPTPPA